MSHRHLGSLTVLLAGAATALAQPPALPAVPQPAPAVAPRPYAPADGPRPQAVVIGEDHRGPAGAQPEGERHEAEHHEEEHHEECHHEEHRPERFWVRGEYLLWYIKNSNFPPLITTGDPTTDRPGALSVPGTRVLFGSEGEDNKDRSGARITAGWWLDEDEFLGLEASYFVLGSRSIGRAAVSSGDVGSPVLARPFFDVLAGREDSSLVAFPTVAGGAVAAYAHSFLQGAEANAVCGLCCGEAYRVEALAGFRWLDLDEDLEVTERAQLTPTAPRFPGALIGVSDRFGVRNDFYGGQVGLRAELRHNRLFAGVYGKVALGFTHERVDASGATVINTPGAGITAVNSGLLALATNSGQFTRDRFAVVPEVGVNLGYRVTEHFRIFAGYTFLYWSEVVRPGDQIDRSLNPTLIPTSQMAGTLAGPRRPIMPLSGTDFWAHGLSVGLELRY
jgi:hypothetical protein